jgi:acetyl-CoA carboxylase biotin carboxyl carrier protein
VTLTARDVAEITRLLEESEFDELHLEHEGFKLTLRRAAAGVRPATPVAAPTAPAPAPPAPAPPRASAAHLTDPALLEVAAPLLGTFYRAPKPGAAPFVELGTLVAEDTIIGIIEVMKLMNTVRAGTRGAIAEICVQDGALVEFGQVLLRIAPGSSA